MRQNVAETRHCQYTRIRNTHCSYRASH